MQQRGAFATNFYFPKSSIYLLQYSISPNPVSISPNPVHLLQISISPNSVSSELAADTIKGHFCLLLNFSYK